VPRRAIRLRSGSGRLAFIAGVRIGEGVARLAGRFVQQG
jgi:hypothetical protein